MMLHRDSGLSVRAGDVPCPHDFGPIQIGACKLGCGAFKYPGGKIEPVTPPKANPYTQVDATPGRSATADAVHNAVRVMRSR